MKPRLELALFVALALLLHLGFWFSMGRAGSESAGSRGDAAVSLMAATGEVADLVEAWTTPAEVAKTSPTRPSAPTSDTSPEAPNMSAVVSQSVVSPDAPDPPSIDPPASVVMPTPLPDPPVLEQPVLQAAVIPPQDAVQVPEDAEGFEAPTSPRMQAPETSRKLPQVDTTSVRPPELDAAPRASLRPVSRPLPRPVQPASATSQVQQSQQSTPQTSSASQQSTSSLPQTAAGEKSGENAGNANLQQPATLSPATRQSLLAQWGASIRNSVERQKRYPRGARASGTAVVRLTVSRSGQLAGLALARSSGTSDLDQAAMSAVKRARFAPAPKQLDIPHYSFNLPLAFSR